MMITNNKFLSCPKQTTKMRCFNQIDNKLDDVEQVLNGIISGK